MRGTRPIGKLDVPRDFFCRRRSRRRDGARATQPGSPVAAIVGDPAARERRSPRFVDIGVDELILVMQMGTVPHELIMESLRTFAEKVMPHFA